MKLLFSFFSADREKGNLCKIIVKKERKREKGNIPLFLFYLNTGENFVVASLQYFYFYYFYF